MKVTVVDQLQLETLDGVLICAGTEDMGSEVLAPIMRHAKSKELFSGKIGETYMTTFFHEGQCLEVGLVGIGTPDTFNITKLRKGLSEGFKALKNKKVATIGVDLKAIEGVFPVDKRLVRLLSSLWDMANYEFNAYKTDAKPSTVESVALFGLEMDEVAFNEGILMGDANVFSRTLTNMPANIMTPAKLAELAEARCLDAGVEVEILDEQAIEALGMHAYMAVAKASANPPRLIVMRYRGNTDSEEVLAYVGKGLTYDSGGLSIKPTASMINMKDDMGGASAVISAISTIAKLGLKINVTAIVAACENMISGTSYKPGDIISSMGGKSIYIGNTDAEGRLTLVDAVTYAIEHEKATKVIDIATLTGAALHCLGNDAAPVISNNDDLYNLVEKAFTKVDEKVWRMPIFDEYKALVKHDQADLTNSAGSPGTITAGIFIGEFVKDVPWVHIDIAGTAYREKAEGVYSKGGTGSGALPLVMLAKKMAK